MTSLNRRLFLLVIAMLTMQTALAHAAEIPHPPGPEQFWIYIGNSSQDGIGLFSFDAKTGTLTSAGIAAAAHAPGFLAISPNQKFLYAGIKLDSKGPSPAGVAGFSIDAVTGKLNPINSEHSNGDEAVFVTVDPSGRNVLVAHYGSATLSVLPIDAAGRLSPPTCMVKETGSSIDPHRQTHAYTHSVNCDPAGKFAITCDLGADKLFVYRLDSATGRVSPNDPSSVDVKPGSGPRHLTFSRDGKFAYMFNEMASTVILYAFDAGKGALTQIQSTDALKQPTQGATGAEVQIDPTGRFLYASNRLDASYLTIFSIDQTTGKLTLIGYQDALGKTPRNFRIDPTGRYLLVANQNSDALVLFAIDSQTGRLSPVGQPIPTVHNPICVKFVAAEK